MPGCDRVPFTPENCPGLTAEQCAQLNTPAEDCDPEFLQMLMAALATHIASSLHLSAEDAQVLFGTLCERFSPPAGDAAPDAQPGEQPDQAAGSAADPAISAASAGPPVAAPGSPIDSPPAALLPSAEAGPETHAPVLPGASANLLIHAFAITPQAALGPRSRGRRDRPPYHHRRSILRRCRSTFKVRLSDRQRALPARRTCYAACAGPP